MTYDSCTCTLCWSAVGSIEHILFDCPCLQDIRDSCDGFVDLRHEWREVRYNKTSAVSGMFARLGGSGHPSSSLEFGQGRGGRVRGPEPDSLLSETLSRGKVPQQDLRRAGHWSTATREGPAGRTFLPAGVLRVPQSDKEPMGERCPQDKCDGDIGDNSTRSGVLTSTALDVDILRSVMEVDKAGLVLEGGTYDVAYKGPTPAAEDRPSDDDAFGLGFTLFDLMMSGWWYKPGRGADISTEGVTFYDVDGAREVGVTHFTKFIYVDGSCYKAARGHFARAGWSVVEFDESGKMLRYLHGPCWEGIPQTSGAGEYSDLAALA